MWGCATGPVRFTQPFARNFAPSLPQVFFRFLRHCSCSLESLPSYTTSAPSRSCFSSSRLASASSDQRRVSCKACCNLQVSITLLQRCFISFGHANNIGLFVKKKLHFRAKFVHNKKQENITFSDLNALYQLQVAPREHPDSRQLPRRRIRSEFRWRQK